MYWNMLKLVMQQPDAFSNVVPLPGAFHVMLNAQEAVLKWYRPIVEKLWAAAYPRHKLPWFEVALQRKYILDLLCRGWKDAREWCISLGIRRASWPVEISSIFLLFEEYVPLCLDLYAIFLSGDFDAYERALYRSLFLFAQLGKGHYVQCVLLFVATVQNWRDSCPAFFEAFRKFYKFTSEEEVETFHSRVRKCAVRHRTAEDLARTVNFAGASLGTVMDWCHAAGVKSHHGGLPLDHHPEAVSAVSEAIKRLFEKAMFAPRPAVYTGKSTWKSSVLGPFSDRMLPLAVQACKGLRGMIGIDISKHKVKHKGCVVLGQRTLCGHVVLEPGQACPQCTNMMREVSKNVLRRVNLMMKLE
jgi:hypothetical protein